MAPGSPGCPHRYRSDICMRLDLPSTTSISDALANLPAWVTSVDLGAYGGRIEYQHVRILQRYEKLTSLTVGVLFSALAVQPLAALKNLTTLDIDCHRVTAQASKFLTSSLTNLTNLTKLRCRGGDLGGGGGRDSAYRAHQPHRA
ncbi:hypothetical protein PIN31115_04528 [Pandoraea iniqua]|uniref:Internalin-A n=2 Tax=Pandoraea iniqua TaxID=2508288 RepID=A0A5E4YJ60_9BURK|nr:hypothetical protein PIN31115_04528 [Pandoraea iniqua]